MIDVCSYTLEQIQICEWSHILKISCDWEKIGGIVPRVGRNHPESTTSVETSPGAVMEIGRCDHTWLIYRHAAALQMLFTALARRDRRGEPCAMGHSHASHTYRVSVGHTRISEWEVSHLTHKYLLNV